MSRTSAVAVVSALALATLGAAPLRAQNEVGKSEKRVVAVMPFTASPEMLATWATAVQTNEWARSSVEEAVSSAILKTGRFRMMERSKITQVVGEQTLQKSESFIDNANLVRQGQLTGASFIVAGSIQAVNTQRIDMGPNNAPGFDGQIIVSLKVVDVASGELLAQDQLKLQKGGLFGLPGTHSTAQGALTAAVRDSKPIREWVERTFPMQFVILDITERDGTRAKKLYIDGGDQDGVRRGMRFDVLEVGEKQIGPKVVKIRSKIARIKVENTEGDEVAICTVEDGADKLATSFDAKSKLIVITGQ